MAHSPLITLTTDFGDGSRYVAQLKGVLLAGDSSVQVVDLTHSVPAQDIAFAARFVAQTTRWFPPTTLHIVVVDPGVGSERRIVYLESRLGRFLGPDNGLWGWLADDDGGLKIWAVENRSLWAAAVAPTFHGRDIMAPVAAQLISGLPPDELGPRIQDVVRILQPQGVRMAQRVEGEVVEIDAFGNLITNITCAMLVDVPRGESCRVECGEHETFGIFQTYADQPEMTLIALIGSSDQLELAIVNDSAQMMLGVRVGEKVVVTW